MEVTKPLEQQRDDPENLYWSKAEKENKMKLRSTLQSCRVTFKNDLLVSLSSIGYNPNTLKANYEIHYLSHSEREMILILSDEIRVQQQPRIKRMTAVQAFHIDNPQLTMQQAIDLVHKYELDTSQKNMHELLRDPISMQKKVKIDEILARVNLQTLRKKVQDKSPYQAYIGCCEKYEQNQYTKMTKKERLQIYRNDWQKLNFKKKKFYAELAWVDGLRDEFYSTQDFYKERIDKIKYDSSSFFNEISVRQAINEYVKDHPERLIGALSTKSKSDQPGQKIQDSNSEEEKDDSSKETARFNVNAEPFKPTAAKLKVQVSSNEFERSIPSNEDLDLKLYFASSGKSLIGGKSANSNICVKLPSDSPTIEPKKRKSMSEQELKEQVRHESTEESPNHAKSHSDKGTQVNIRTLIKEIGLNPDHHIKQSEIK